MAQIETPSGKGAGDENFPVGSWLIAADLRPHIATFYQYARAIDDIADNADLFPADKIARLDAMADALVEADAEPLATARRMADSLAATGVSPQHCLALVSAFRQDAVKNRYADWAELIDYCDRSAAPVGRYLLDLHGEDKALYPPADALCNALQVINHLQDASDDLAALDRCYLPLNWLAEAGASIDGLRAARADPALLAVIRRCVGATEALLDQAEPLIAGLKNRRLAMESAVIHAIARRLCAELSRRDPVAERVELNKFQIVACGLAGIAAVLRRKRR